MLWSVLHEKAQEQGLPLTTVVAEVLHLILLDNIFARPESQSLCFQGGTCIHLLHKGYRYSEDLDFAGELNLSLFQQIMKSSRSNIEKNVVQLLGRGQCEWRLPSSSIDRRIVVVWFHFQPQERVQKHRVKIEFARYPIYEPKVLPVHSEFDVFHRRPLINALTPEELLAEKITAIAGRHYIKGRDLFDVWYLSDILGTSINFSLVEKKFIDYNVSKPLLKVSQELQSYKLQTLSGEMARFLPLRYRMQLQKDDYETFRQSTLKIINYVLSYLSS